jgi:hypothetical protein
MSLREAVRSASLFPERRYSMQDRKVTPDMVPVIKLARSRKFNYARIAAYYQINQGRIADVMKGRLYPSVPPATSLPADFPTD